ncbi:DNA sulfur modification protein DndB [Bacillus luti]|uniref:DNA sulfur modification protein DndB n=1 Tax=Bacillus luti TaxID=2026191 RepID=UPI0012E827D4|nr:DNA sulfur modification protein DndB [Bacillus luti]
MFNVKLRGNIGVTNSNKDKAMMTTQIKVKDILNIHRIDSTVNRDLNYSRLPNLTKYIDGIDSEIGIYLPAIVCSFNEDPTPYYNKQTMELELPLDSRLVIIDGQHRIKSLERFIANKGVSVDRREEVLESYMTLQLYFGLSKEDERRLFADINSNSKRISMSLVTNFDTRDILNILTKELYSLCRPLRGAEVEFVKSKIVRPQNNQFCTSVRLKKIISFLFFGKKTASKREEELIKQQYDEIIVFLDKFFTNLFDVFPQVPGDVIQYVLGHESIQYAIALYLHSKIMVNNDEGVEWADLWEEEVDKLNNIDWSVRNSIWQPYMLVARAGTRHEFKAFVDGNYRDLLEVLEQQTSS